MLPSHIKRRYSHCWILLIRLPPALVRSTQLFIATDISMGIILMRLGCYVHWQSRALAIGKAMNSRARGHIEIQKSSRADTPLHRALHRPPDAGPARPTRAMLRPNACSRANTPSHRATARDRPYPTTARRPRILVEAIHLRAIRLYCLVREVLHELLLSHLLALLLAA